MSTEEINTIAREYAEFTDMSLVDKKNISAICEYFLQYTLRRYCLVEKSKVSEMYDVAMEISRLPKSVEARGYAISRLQTLERLFPEIAKEVEG